MKPGAPIPPPLVDAHGRPVETSGRCPGCGAKSDQRVQTTGFGRVRPVICRVCGHEFPAEIV